MIEKLKAIPGFIYAGLLALVGLVLYVIKVKQLERANSELETAEYKRQDDLDNQQATTVQKQIQEVVERNEQSKKQQLTTEELAKKLDNI
jgi:hypothetical protein